MLKGELNLEENHKGPNGSDNHHLEIRIKI